MATIDKTFDKVLNRALTPDCPEDYKAHDFRHVECARDIRKSTLIDLYRKGKVSVGLALHYGAKPKDHLARLETMDSLVDKARFAQELIKAGVDIDKLDMVRRRLEGKAQAKAKPVEAPRQAMMVMKRQGAAEVIVAPTAVKRETLQKQYVAAIVDASRLREKARKVIASVREKGITPTLSAREQADMLARMKAKHVDK